MNTLELTLQRKTDSGYPVIAALTRPGGFLPLRREGMLNLDTAALTELQYEPLAYGTALGQALFIDEIRDTFVKALGDESLRVLLSIEAPDLRAIDWHRLAAPFDGRWRCLASQQNTPFSLSVPSPASAHFPALGRRDLRALLLVAGPETLSGDYKLAPFDVPATTESIKTALGDIPCDILDNPSLDALCAALTATPYTFLHLVCHGAVKENGETILFFPKDSKRTPTPATDLLNRLSSLARLPHFAFIAACESALPQNGLGSLAGRLVRELGLPAVLAMTDRVSIATASAIATPFYAHLYEHGQPDLALAQSLAGLQGAHDLTVPAIFSRLGDRPLFDDNSERALTEKELEFGLAKLAEALPERAPVMDSLRDALTRRLRSTLGADVRSLSESSRAERKETIDQLNSLSLEALDLSFNALCLGQTPPAYDSRSPFRGLESFRPEDAEYFFGRETLTKKLVQKLNGHNFLAVLGASGSGKSSLVMAGLIPALNVPYAIFRPGAEPLSELDKALQADPALLVVDQFEELFTLSAREQRLDFISRLLEQSHKIRVVITLRADFLGEVAPFKSLKDEVQNHQEIIPPMDEAELRRAMEGQAGCAGLRFESDLSQQMLDDVSGEPGAMPLLQHALWTLWTRRHGRWLRAEEYRAFGGVKQAIASTAEAVFARCTEFEKERLRDIFLRLTRLDESADGRDTRRRVLLRDLIPADSDPAATTLLIKQLADARLVVVTGDEVEVAHEALIRHWERLRAWLNDDRDNLRLREGVSDDARRWENAHRDESLLNHRGPRLELALAMSKNPRYRLNPVEQEYLDGCLGLREREKAAAARRRKYAIAGVSAAMIVIIAILAGWGWSSSENAIALEYQVATAEYSQQQERAQASTAVAAQSTAVAESNLRATAQANAETQKDEIEKQSQIIRGRELAAQSQALHFGKGESIIRSALLAAESFYLLEKDKARWQVEQAAMRYLEKSTLPIATMLHDGWVHSVIFSPNGDYVVFNSNNIAHILETKNWEKITTLENAGKGIAISPDGKYIVITSGQTARVLEILTGTEIAHANVGSYGGIETVIYSPDGKFVLMGSVSGDAKVWDPFTGNEILSVRGYYHQSMTLLAFSPDSKYFVANSGGYPDYTVRVWEILTGKEVAQMKHESDVKSVDFSPIKNHVVSGGLDGKARVWDINTGKEITTITTNGFIEVVKFSPDGQHIATGDSDGTINVWESLTGKQVSKVSHQGIITSVIFHPNGEYIISASYDNTARVWDMFSGREVILLPHDRAVTSIAVSRDGQYVVSGSNDMTVRIWNLKSERANSFVLYDSSQIDSRFLDYEFLDFHPNGQYVISGNTAGDIQVWDVVTGREISRMSHKEFRMNYLRIHPNGQYVISANTDGIARVWDTFTGNEIQSSDVFAENEIEIAKASFKASTDFYGRTNSVSVGNQYISVISTPNTVLVKNIMSDSDVIQINTDYPIGLQAISQDDRYIVTVSEGPRPIIKIWEIKTGREITNIERKESGYLSSVMFSPDGEHLVIKIGNEAQIWETSSGHKIFHIIHNEDISSIAFSNDGQYIVSGSHDRTTRIWEISSGNEIARINYDFAVSLVAFSPDGKYIVSYTGNKAEIYWIIEDLDIELCQYIPRNLTRSEWQQFGFNEPYRATCPNLPIEPEPTATPTP